MPLARVYQYLLFAASFAVAVGALGPAVAYAQEPLCGGECMDCITPDEKQAKFDLPNTNNGKCHMATACEECPEVLVAENARPEEEFIRTLLSARPEDLSDVLGNYQGRLLVNRARRLVAVRGSACSPEKITSVVFLGRAKIDALVSLGLDELDDFLARVQAGMPR